MRIPLLKRGADAVALIPASVVSQASLRVGQVVDVRAESGRIIVDAGRGPSLVSLMAAMRPETFHDEVDWGPPMGEEIW